MSDTVIRDSDPSVERDDLLIEAQPFLKVLASIITRLHNSDQTNESPIVDDETQLEV